MLRQKHAQEEAESEVTHVRRRWRGFRDRKTDRPPIEQIEAVQVESAETEEFASRTTALQRTLRKRKIFLRTTFLGAGILTLGLITLLTKETQGFGPTLGLIFGGEALVITTVFGGETAYRVAVNALASTDDLRAVGPLAEALTLGGSSYSLAVSALTRLLPRLQPSDGELLNETQRACLHRALKQSSSRRFFWHYNPPFAHVLRRALTTLDALPHAERATGKELLEQRPPNVEALLLQFQAAVHQRSPSV